MLIEDYPGVGKTALARALARSMAAEYARVQCTVDLLPADVIGTNVFNQREARFEFHPGPVFANVVLVDEINRTSPKTQSGLLECMQERHVTIDGQAHELARPFIVIATQNPIEYEGTYPLPEAQLDRFMVQIALGLPGRPTRRPRCSPPTRPTTWCWTSEPVADVGTVLAAQAAAAAVHGVRGPAALRRRRSATATRRDARVELGASPRAALLLFRAAKALRRARGSRSRAPGRRAGACALRPRSTGCCSPRVRPGRIGAPSSPTRWGRFRRSRERWSPPAQRSSSRRRSCWRAPRSTRRPCTCPGSRSPCSRPARASGSGRRRDASGSSPSRGRGRSKRMRPTRSSW